jgi:carbamoyltransferase
MRILSFGVTHDSSVCSVNDGKIEFFCKEERLTRIKRDKNPLKSLDLYKQLNFGKVDHVLFLTPSNCEPQVEYFYDLYFQKIFNLKMQNYSALLHHKCHATLAFYNSGFKKALVFVIDRNGSIFFINGNRVARESESVFICSYPDNINPLYKSFALETKEEKYKETILQEIKNFYKNVEIKVNSLGIVKVYEAATTLIGQPALENGKTMGLSSYGENKNYSPLFFDNTPINNLFSEVEMFDRKDQICFYGEKQNILKEVPKNNYQYYANRAKQVQLETQKEALNLIETYVKKTGINNVCIVGGYGLNVVANYYYLKNLPNVNFCFEPVADDTGISMGAGLLKYREETKDTKIITTKNNFYHYYDYEEEINSGEQATISQICDMLINQKSIAIFDGNPEAGPRALGHRSILFDPRSRDSKEKINLVKKREWYRPFAGIILESEFTNYFDTAGLTKSEYMTISFDAKENAKKLVPGIIHVDGTCRIQTISEGFLFEILTEFYKLTGCPMLLNTSFNLAGDPLVQIKKDAIDMLQNSCLDAVFFVGENKLVKK